jgi:hypothetical protein
MRNIKRTIRALSTSKAANDDGPKYGTNSLALHIIDHFIDVVYLGFSPSWLQDIIHLNFKLGGSSDPNIWKSILIGHTNCFPSKHLPFVTFPPNEIFCRSPQLKNETKRSSNFKKYCHVAKGLIHPRSILSRSIC